jgi:hypothetical protein
MNEKDGTYYGWKNRQTWNVALWIRNDQGLYSMAKDCQDYQGFVDLLREAGPCFPLDWPDRDIMTETPDGVAWNDSGLDIPRLDELIQEIRGGETLPQDKEEEKND